jgi:flagellar basal-body rod protein FlgC
MQAMEISRTGLDVEWRRLEVIAENIANANTTRTPSGGAYQSMRLISGPRVSFADRLAKGDASGLAGVAVYGLEPTGGAPRRVYEPGHPDADSTGFVSYPAFDQAGEMTLMIKTSRAYEANIVVMNMARQMYMKAMDLGKRS